MPGMGITVRLPQLVGIDRARFMSLTSDFIDATRPYEWGLVTEVAWNAENARARAWMSRDFDQARLRRLRAEIIERGRAQQ